MRKSFSTALKVFKYIILLFIPIYWVGIIIDDWGFVEKYWDEHRLEYLGIWTLWFLVYAFALAFYYWLATTLIILIYHKILKPIRAKY